MRNIMVTDFNGEDVMIFTDKLTPEQVEDKLTSQGQSFGEIYEVKDEEVQYYIYEPCWI